jgi:ribosomal protein L37AE/L43A
MGYPEPSGAGFLVWACRACGATFTYDGDYTLRPYITEIIFPACPDCGADMLASRHPSEDASTLWRCGDCGGEISL